MICKLNLNVFMNLKEALNSTFMNLREIVNNDDRHLSNTLKTIGSPIPLGPKQTYMSYPDWVPRE